MFKKIKDFLGIGLSAELSSYTVISKDTGFNGTITNGKVYIEGSFKSLDSANFEVLKIALNGTFVQNREQEFYTNILEIAGDFTGNVICEEAIIHKTAKVYGKITSKNLSIARGALIDAILSIKN